MSICDAWVIASPNYYHWVSSRVEMFLERLYTMTDIEFFT